MADPYADPTSIDYVLQRAQDAFRRGEIQHSRSSQTQYTNHVKELLSNLERYLETCGVQLPVEVLTGAETTAAAALNEANSQQEAARAPYNGYAKSGFLSSRRNHMSPSTRSVSAPGAVGSGVANGSYMGETAQPRVGWGTLATPTERARQLDHSSDERGNGYVPAVTVARHVKPDPGSGGLMTSLGNHDCHLSLSLNARPEAVEGNVGGASEEARSRFTGKASAVDDSYHSHQQQQRQYTPLREGSPPSPHSPPGKSAANPTVAPLAASPVRDGSSFSMVSGNTPFGDTAVTASVVKSGPVPVPGSPQPFRPYQQQQQRTPHMESLGYSAPPHTSPEAAAAHARSVSLNAVAAGTGAHMSSGTDPWNDFGQFVQSITESRLNSNLNSLQSAAAAAFPIAVGYNTNPPHTTTTRCHENTTTTTSATTFTVPVALPVKVPDNGFQLPHVLATAPLPGSPSIKDLRSAQQQPQQQRPRHAAPYRGTTSPLDVGSVESFSQVAASAENTNMQEGGGQSSRQLPTIGTEVTSISSRSPSLPLQAAYGAGSKAVRTLAVKAELADEKTKPGEPPALAQDRLHSTPAQSANQKYSEERDGGAMAPVECIPSPPLQPRSSVPTAPLYPTVPMQRAASLPVAAAAAAARGAGGDYLPYGQGGSPFYPHILRVCVAPTSSTQRSSSSQPASNKSPAPPSPQPPSERGQASEGDGAMAADAVLGSAEKEQLKRRLRGILDKSSSPSATPSVMTSLVEGGGPIPSVNGEAWGPTTPPATAPCVVVASSSSPGGGEPLPPLGRARVAGVTYPPFAAVHSDALRSPLDPPQREHESLHGHAASLDSGREGDDTSHSSEAPHATSPTTANVLLHTPSSRDMSSLPTALYSASRRTLFSHDLSAGCQSSGPAPSNGSPYYQAPAQRADSSHTTTRKHIARTAAPHYLSVGESALPDRPIDIEASTSSTPFRRGPPNNVWRDGDVLSPERDVADIDAQHVENDNSSEPLALRSNITGFRRHKDERPFPFAGAAAREEGEEAVRNEKLQLMQRLRMMLSRSDD